jgi:hypothetical protein
VWGALFHVSSAVDGGCIGNGRTGSAKDWGLMVFLFVGGKVYKHLMTCMYNNELDVCHHMYSFITRATIFFVYGSFLIYENEKKQ